jgi:D-alanine-D-alanine ligase
MSKENSFFVIQKDKRAKFNFLNLAKSKFDIIFIAMHGTLGEDGGVQGMLETLGVKYTGPGVLSSALAMNKVFAAEVYLANDLPHPDFVHFKKDGWKRSPDKIINDIVSKVGFPMVIKPVDQGSAVGVSKVKSHDELRRVIDKTIKSFPWLIAQKFIKGKEATCGVLEKDNQVMALPPTHILPNLGEFYDYKSKYSTGGSTHICPADFGDIINQQIQNLAVMAHKALDCRGMSRTDIFVGDDKKLYILETNTIPGMTPTSLFPEAAAKAGISFSKMLDYIIEASL